MAVPVRLLRSRLFLAMERHAVTASPDDRGTGGYVFQVSLLPTVEEQEEATSFISQRFPAHCPHHLLHNLVNGHYTQHQLCSARPFQNEQCRHGTHARPQLPADEMERCAPAAGALIFLPFGLSCRVNGSGVGCRSRLVAGCADCEFLGDGDTCGACRRVWTHGGAYPARGIRGTEGQYASLATWRESVDLSGACLPECGEVDEEESWGEEDWGEEDWGEEEDYEEDGDGEEAWEEEEEEQVAAPTDRGGGDDTGNGGDGGAPAWGDGRWASDGRGGWSWTVDFPVALPAPVAAAVAIVPAAPRPEVPAAPAAAAASDATVRILELELELARLRQANPA